MFYHNLIPFLGCYTQAFNIKSKININGTIPKTPNPEPSDTKQHIGGIGLPSSSLSGSLL